MRDCFCGADKGVCPDCMEEQIADLEILLLEIKANCEEQPSVELCKKISGNVMKYFEDQDR